MPSGLELAGQFTQTAAHLFAFALRILFCFRLDQLEQLALYLRVFFSTGCGYKNTSVETLKNFASAFACALLISRLPLMTSDVMPLEPKM
jgi:hypothetical protein